ncbi:MAG: DNA polymerase I [Rhodospirillaceae bacterium]|nr:DNA polymerase I [Rhodospirillaceae bacterium]
MNPAALPAAARDRIYLVDGSGYIFRAFHALPPFTRSDGTPTGAVYGFVNMLLKLLTDTAANHLAVIFDAGQRSFRNDIYAGYKANRPEVPAELVPQFALVREATRALNLPAIEEAGFEADDLIASYARAAEKAGADVTIVSSDKDLMQLVGDRIAMLDPIKNRKIGISEVREKFGVDPERVVDVQALAGDSTDNVPGVPGIGVKTAAELINTYGSLDALLARADEIKQPKRREALLANRDKALLSRQLVKLKDDMMLPAPLASLALRGPDPATLLAFLKAQEFKALIQRMETRFGLAPGQDSAAAAAVPVIARAPEPGAATYEAIQDWDALDAWITRAADAGILALRVLGTHTDPMRADIVGIGLAVAPGSAGYIPLGHALGELDLGAGAKAPQLDRDGVLARLKPLLADRAVLKIGHNVKYDVEMLAERGIEVVPVDDTMLLSYVLEGGLHNHELDTLADLHLKHKPPSREALLGSGKSRIGLAQVPPDKALGCAGAEVDAALRLHGLLKPRLGAERMVGVYETIERPLIPILADMERAGIGVDRDELNRLSRDFGERLAALETEIYRLAGHAFNIGSPKQLGEVLFDELRMGGDKLVKTGKTGAYATGAEVLELLAAQGHGLPARVLDWRQIAKLKSTYADALVGQINVRTGRVHTCYAMAVASTGRLSSNDPNLQNIPTRTEEGRKIRRAFVADPGNVLVSLDYSQIELRLLADVAGIDSLKVAFRDGIDIHALTASQVFGVPVAGMDPQVRRKAKAINFGIIYGISAFGLAKQLGIPQAEAGAYIKAYFERYPGIRDYMERTKAECRERGYVTTPFGRRIHIPGIKERNAAHRSFAERAAINAPLQGGAADIIKRAMVRVPDALGDTGSRARMLLQVHDELLFEAPKAEAESIAAVIGKIMAAAASLSVPLVVDVGTGANWADAH